MIAVAVGAFYSTYAPIVRDEDKLTHFINPTNYVYAIGKLTKQHVAIKETLKVQTVGADLKCLQARRDQPDLSHDYLFHSVLGLLDVTTVEYQPVLDIFHSCKTGG